MATPIHPEALKTYRKRKHLTQEQLAEATRGQDKVSLPTIKRIESTKGAQYPANARVAATLARALGVEIDKLSQPPSDPDAPLREIGYRPVRIMLDEETTLAFSMVHRLYGLSMRSQIEMAPLFAALLAEASLASRRKRIDAIDEASARLQELGGGHLSFVYAAWRVDEGAAEERESIAARDLLGVQASDHAFDCGYDRSTNNPFADYLESFAQDAQASTVTLYGWTNSDDLPRYRIGADIISQLTGDDPDAECALLRGHVRLKDIPNDLLGDERKADRVAWMISRIPEDELAKRRIEREVRLAIIDPDAAGSRSASDEANGGGHA